jgi:acetamidase/formamidase
MCATSIAGDGSRPGPRSDRTDFITGAAPGDVLEVRILDGHSRLRLQHTSSIRWHAAERLRNSCVLPINREAKTVEIAPGVVMPLDRPAGTMGVAPPAVLGRIGSGPPGVHTGNLDKGFGAGSTLTCRCMWLAR